MVQADAKLDQIKVLLEGIQSDGGGTQNGKLYQNYPWEPFDQLPAHFTSTQQKLEIILQNLRDVKNEVIMDYGCANGAISIALAERGAWVHGVDRDLPQLEIARIVAAERHVGRVVFGPPPVSGHILQVGGTYDTVICLTVWKWVVRQSGYDGATKLLEDHAKRVRSTYLFDPGVSGAAGTDLGVTLPGGGTPELLAPYFPHIEMAGSFVDNMNILRTIWKAWK